MRGDCRIWGGGGDRLSVWSSVEDVKMSEIYRSLKQNPVFFFFSFFFASFLCPFLKFGSF